MPSSLNKALIFGINDFSEILFYQLKKNTASPEIIGKDSFDVNL
jgi:hypothetical protein